MRGKTWLKPLVVFVGVSLVVAAVWVLFPLPSEVVVVENVTLGENPKTRFASFYERENISLVSSSPQYSLPLDLESVANYAQMGSWLGLSDAQVSALSENGFVVVPFGQENDVVEVYKSLRESDVPVFITSDSLLHLYHIQFDEILKTIEENEFFDYLEAMTEAMLEDSSDQYDSLSGDLKEAAKRNVAYFAVARKLLDPGADIPDSVEDEVVAELELIDQHSGFASSPIFGYKEDYSQYVPRGHYTRSETLERYFKTMMWYGRIAFLLRGAPDTISEEDSDIQTMQASLIASSMDRIKVDGTTVDNLWNRIYSVTAFFVGLADDLTPYEYENAILEVFGEEFDLRDLTQENNLLNLKAVLANMRSPKIYGGTGNVFVYPPVTRESLREVLDKTKGMRFMGQRYVPDSYMFQRLVFPSVVDYTGEGRPFTWTVTAIGRETRGFPRGLDVMAVFGSDRALEILEEEGDTEYENYYEQLDNLRGEFSALDEAEWNRNLYWSWLYTLKALLTECGEGYPTFMQTQAWQDKQLNTALASWAELRHDTILYAKQSYTPVEYGSPPTPPGYVEPVPEFYARALSLTRMTTQGLTGMEVLDQTSRGRLLHLENILSRLVELSEKELENMELSEDDYSFIRNFGEELELAVTGVESRTMSTTIIADVHTDSNSGNVVEEGVGYVDLILVAYKTPDGQVTLAAGPTLSHYEFKQPMENRLTDEAWVEMLKTSPPQRAPWTESFFVES
jgi:hypothetical protein